VDDYIDAAQPLAKRRRKRFRVARHVRVGDDADR
jgi:hypothetical protein